MRCQILIFYVIDFQYFKLKNILAQNLEEAQFVASLFYVDETRIRKEKHGIQGLL